MAWRLNKIALVAAFAACQGVPNAGQAQEAGPQSLLSPDWLKSRVNERGQHCERRAEQRYGKKLLVACGPAGVWEIALDDNAPHFVRGYEFSGDVVGFVTEPDGRLWVKLQVLEARPFTAAETRPAMVFPDDSATGAPPAPVAPSPSAPPAPPAQSAVKKVGRVTRSEPGQVAISLGSVDGVARSNRIELALDHPDDSGEDRALSRETVAIGVVTAVTDHSARVRLGLSEDVPVGAFATPTLGQATSSLSAPPRVTRLWELQLLARPFAALGELGGGALLSGSLGYRFTHLHLQAVIDPFGVGDVKDDRAVTAANAAVLASYDSQYFEMGLGLGAQTVNDPDFLLNPGSGLAALQLIRLGSQDGLHLSARTNIVLFHREFQFGGMVASGQIPITRGYWLLVNGGGGNVGYGFGELGLRVMLAGNALAGSKFLTVTAGGAAVYRGATCDEFFTCDQQRVYGGPMAGVGGEWRF